MSQDCPLHTSHPLQRILKQKDIALADLINAVRCLLESGHNPSEVDENGQTAVHVCAEVGGPIEVLKLLVEKTDVETLNATDSSSMTPLHCLLDEDRVVDPACLKCLVDAGASLTIVSETKGTPLDCLCRHSDGVNDLFDCLLRIALSVLRRKKEYLLKTTLQTGSATFLELLLSHWHSLSDDLWTNSLARPVFDALSSSRDAEAKTQLVMDYGADPAVEVWPDRQTLVHRAVALGSMTLLQAAFANGADLSSKDDSGQTPLHVAVQGGRDRQAIVDFLIENFASLNDENDDGDTALDVAVGAPTRNLDAAASLIRAGSKLPRADVPHDVVIALSDPNVIMRSVNPILTALEVGAFVMRTSQIVTSDEEEKSLLELSDNLVSFASDLATVGGSNDDVMTTAISVALKNRQAKFLLSSKVGLCLDNLFFRPPVRRRRRLGQSSIGFVNIARFLAAFFMLHVRLVFFPCVLFFYILPRYGKRYETIAHDFVKAEARYGSVIYYVLQGLSHLYLCLLLFFGAGAQVAPSHYRDAQLSSFEQVTIVFLVGKIAYELGQLRRQGARDYITQISNATDVAIILLLIIGFGMRFSLMSSAHASVTTESSLAVLYALLFLAACFRFLFYLMLFPYFGPMILSARRLIFPMISFLFLYTVILFSFGVSYKNIFAIKLFKSWCQPSVNVTSSNVSCFSTFQEALNQIPLDMQRLDIILQSLFLTTVNMGSAGQLGITASTSYTSEEILATTWGVVWLILSAIVLLNMLIALVSNAYQNSEDNAETEWVYLKANIITEIHNSPVVSSPLNLFYYFGMAIARIVSLLCRWKKTEDYENKVALWRDRRRSDILVRDHILANFKAVAEIKDKDEPVTKGDIDALRAEIMEALASNRTSNFCCHDHVIVENEKENVAHWVSDHLRRQLSSVRRKIEISGDLLENHD